MTGEYCQSRICIGTIETFIQTIGNIYMGVTTTVHDYDDTVTNQTSELLNQLMTVQLQHEKCYTN